MKRDDDYLRNLLLEAEADRSPIFMARETIGGGEDEHRRSFHAKLLVDAGLAEQLSSGVYRITNQGHDYLASIRDETIWKKTKEAAQVAGGASLLVLRDIAIEYGKQAISAHLGIRI